MKTLKNIIIILLLTAGTLLAVDNAHFYRAPFFFGEPRFEKNYLTSLDINVATGATTKARNSEGKTTCLLNIYGLQNMHKLGSNVPYKDPTNPADLTLILLSRVAGRDNFGQFLFTGRFDTTEAAIAFTKNFKRGFFGKLHFPIRKLELCNLCFIDQSPTSPACPNRYTPEWQAFLNLFDVILNRYNISIAGYKKTDIGDTSFLLGWARNYQETEVLDFLDLTVQGGILIPTGRETNEDQAFDIPSGYNGHIGMPLSLDGAFGAYDWLTIGGHVGVLLFNKKTKNIRMKTDTQQNGFIKLAQGKACIKKGTIWDIGTYIKADHCVRGFSLLFGYSFISEHADTISPCDTTIFDQSIVNSDELFKGWNMHTLFFMADYDFAQEDSCLGPRIGIFYNLQVGGKRVFKTSMGGGTLGIDAAWNF